MGFEESSLRMIMIFGICPLMAFIGWEFIFMILYLLGKLFRSNYDSFYFNFKGKVEGIFINLCEKFNINYRLVGYIIFVIIGTAIFDYYGQLESSVYS